MTEQTPADQHELRELRAHNAQLQLRLKDAWVEIAQLKQQLKIKQPQEA